MPTAAAIMLMIIWNKVQRYELGKKLCWIQNLSNLMHLALNYRYKLTKQPTSQLTPKKENSSSEFNLPSVSPEIPQILWHLNIHHNVHNSLTLVPVPSHINSVYTLPSYFFKVNFNITFPSEFRFSKCSIFCRLPLQKPACTSLIKNTCHMHHPPQP